MITLATPVTMEDAIAAGNGTLHGAIEYWQTRALAAESERQRLDALINTPHTDDWFDAVRLEAAHQQERWGAYGDAAKTPMDWFWLIGYLSGKALAAFLSGDKAKGRHHIISTSAALLNWHRADTGEMTQMQPGHAPSVARGDQ